ncbi:hypothetical protein [Methylophilus sp. QUAN]|uniref:hypothetical protein n=1 Tax=Methylophilus sp. QUAN TaxID=2781020 RepID=UPI00188F74F8|nr:hypothetical protein [Methylophilus sp. QUAN]MBF4992159.1 hypothetical protein [Methylophilus sp. QUAN]
MTLEETQLFNDLIKVGLPIMGTLLGGLIGATSTFMITKLNHSNERIREITQKRLDLVLQIANDVTEFEHLISTYATAISNHLQGLASIDMEDARKAVINRNQPLRRARMNLKLLNLKEAENYLEEYVELTREVISKGPNLKVSRASELTKTITKGPIQFYSSLASEFPKG